MHLQCQSSEFVRLKQVVDRWQLLQLRLEGQLLGHLLPGAGQQQGRPHEPRLLPPRHQAPPDAAAAAAAAAAAGGVQVRHVLQAHPAVHPPDAAAAAAAAAAAGWGHLRLPCGTACRGVLSPGGEA
eukprot:CAMPEP_0202920350 /NCGR_PEP_ID=MMETSP1392-20130828/76810_1 /ASSEMBLY_ACC=CAM_ASM_000868 /TAXON_ID=225041 /ORGANISM="Chlamydomonas chlamydogama, Strain SAG 11-48b" /LENGTH=125 /DNA_ID=CAMNT_0049613841 /DNA_START=334 /DNA_END=712 /DNA_ORIENTATION=-